MASTKARFTILSDTTPISVFLTEAEDGLVAPSASAYTVTADTLDGDFLITIPEACIGIYRLEVQDGDGIVIGIGFVWLEADDTETYIVDDSFVQLQIHKLHKTNTDTLAAIKLKTDLIGTAEGTVNTPTNGTTIQSPLVVGDNYLTDLGNAFIFNFTPPSGAEVGDSSVYFGGKRTSAPLDTWEVIGDLVNNGDGTWKATFELDASVTGDLTAGFYDWSVSFCDGTYWKTIARGTRVRWVPKQTTSTC